MARRRKTAGGRLRQRRRCARQASTQTIAT